MIQKEHLNNLWHDYSLNKNDENLKKQLVEYYYSYVGCIANKMAKNFNFYHQPEELASHGVLGLYRAIELYDPNMKNKFETYAFTKIRGAILDGLRSEDHISRGVRERSFEIEETRLLLERQNSRPPTDEEVCEVLNIDPNDYYRRISRYKAASTSSIEVSSSDTVDEDNKKDFNNCLICNDSGPDEKLNRMEFFYKLIAEKFGETEKKIIYLYYYEDNNFREISEVLGLTESRVSQIHKKIIKELKTHIENNKDYFDSEIITTISGYTSKKGVF